jgi:hypothetical protein
MRGTRIYESKNDSAPRAIIRYKALLLDLRALQLPREDWSGLLGLESGFEF